MAEAYLLAGPTASGKSAVAAILARRTGAAILNADSMLVYRGMDIGTAKPGRAEQLEFSMGGIDLVSPADAFSSGEWLRRAADYLSALPPGRPVVIVGGTGLYFTALLRGLSAPWTDPPPAYPVLTMPREILRDRIRRRIGEMFDAGLPEEVGRLRRQYPRWSVTAAAAIGYKEFFTPSAVPGRTVRENIYFHTSQFAKRQLTYFRHQASPIWIEAGDGPEAAAEGVAAAWRAHGPWSFTL